VAHVTEHRQKHQSYRGGSAICFLSNRPLWAAWSDLIQKIQDCSSDVQPSTARSHSALQTAGNHSMAEADGDTASMTGQRSAKLL